MRRDLELIRKLALAVEDRPDGDPERLEIEGYTEGQIGYHSYLLVDAGLAQGIDASALGDTLPNWLIFHLTSAGHDFCDAARNESRWRKAIAIIKAKGGSATIDVVKQVLVAVLKGQLDL